MTLDVRDARLLDIVGADSEAVRLGTGFGFTEGPVWDARRKRVVFSDMAQDHMRSWSAADGVRTFRRPSNKANGSTFDMQGRLLSCEHSTSRVVRQEEDGSVRVLCATYGGRELNSPNDIVVASDGAVVFTDPTYGRIREDLGLLREPELAFRGVYRLRHAGAEPELLADDFEQPNGLCFSVDETRLFVNDTARRHIRAFDVDRATGAVTGGAVWAELHGDQPGNPDGMKVDRDGNLYCCGPGGIHVFDPGARCQGVIVFPEHPANFVWGGDDLRTLFATARTSLYSMRTLVPGHLPYVAFGRAHSEASAD